jgi:hypothetical protein
MKKKSVARGYRMKGSAAPKNIDDYLAGVPEPARGTLEKIAPLFRLGCRQRPRKVLATEFPHSN